MLSSALVLGALLATAAPVSASTATPTLTVTASGATTVGNDIFANANLLGADHPTGVLAFRLYGPDDTDCTTPIFRVRIPVDDTSVRSDPVTTQLAGTYRWTARYIGDGQNASAGPSACSEDAAAVVVDPARSYVDMVATPPDGRKVQATARLSGGFQPRGSITFTLAGPDDPYCSQDPVFSSTVPVNGTGTYSSQSYSAPGPGTYRWRAIYNGDANNLRVGPTGCIDDAAAVTVE